MLAWLEGLEGPPDAPYPQSRIAARMCHKTASHSSPGTHRIRISRAPPRESKLRNTLIAPAPYLHASIRIPLPKGNLIYHGTPRNFPTEQSSSCRLQLAPVSPVDNDLTRPNVQTPQPRHGSNGPETTCWPLRLACSEPTTKLQYALLHFPTSPAAQPLLLSPSLTNMRRYRQSTAPLPLPL